MSLTKGTRVVKSAMARESRMQKSKQITAPNGYKIVNETGAINVLKGYTRGVLNSSDIDDVMNILEVVEEKGSGKYIANYIANEIVPGIPSKTSIKKYNISKESKLIIESAISKNTTYDRVISNQEILERRFNIDKICKEKRFAKPVIESLCELIDTYEVPLTYKFNIALENGMYSLVKNNIIFESDIEVANYVLEYFMTRDSVIYDNTYKRYQELLKESDFYDINEATGLSKALLNNSGNYFGDKVKRSLDSSNDKSIKEFGRLFNDTFTEADIVTYLNTVSNHCYKNVVEPMDMRRLQYSINLLPQHTGVNPEFIKMKADSLFGDISDFKNIDMDVPDLNNDIFAPSLSIKDIISEAEAAQNKDEEWVNNVLDDLMRKPVKNLLSDVYNVFKIIHMAIKITIASFVLISLLKIFKKINKFINFLCSNANPEQKKQLLINLQSFYGISKEVTGEKKKAVSEFEKNIKRLVDANSGVYKEEMNLFNLLSKEDAPVYCAALFEAAYDLMNKKIDSNSLSNLIKTCSDQKCIDYLYEIYNYSNFDKTIFENAYNNIFDSKVMKPLESIQYESYKYDTSSVISLFYMIEATNILENIEKESVTGVVVEGSFFNTIKLALVNMRAKAQKFNMKQKQLWNTLDSYAKRFTKSAEESSNERRNKIINGTVMPSFSKCIKSAIALAGAGVVTNSVMVPIIGAFGLFATSKGLDYKERKQLIDEIEIELKVLDKEIELAEKNDDTSKYRDLLKMQRKLQHEYTRIKGGRKAFKF